LSHALVDLSSESQEMRMPDLRKLAGYLPRWCAVFTTPRHEKRIAWHFGQRQLESFLPLYRAKRRWKNRCTVTLELPLFPNYLFVRIDPRERIRVLDVPGVLSIVSSGREVLPVPDHYIASLRDGLLTHRIEPHANVETGDKVRITTGPMSGMEGVLDRQKNELRVVLRLEMIGRSVAVEVSTADIELIGIVVKRSPDFTAYELPKPGMPASSS
jgi:transcription antitermination factor NusG